MIFILSISMFSSANAVTKSYVAESNYNVRKNPSFNGRVIAQTIEGSFRTTGKVDGVWREVISATGQKGWINRKGVDYSRRVIPTAVAPKVSAKVAEPAPAPAPAVSELLPVTDSSVIGKNGTPSIETAPSVPVKILNPTPSSPPVTASTQIEKPVEIAKPAPATSSKPVEQEMKSDDEGVAQAGTSGNSGKSSSECQGFKDAQMKKNCETLMRRVASGELPKKATLFALKTFKETVGSYCGGKTIANKYRNKCSFMFSNLDGIYKGQAYQSPAYLIDLCAGDSSRTTMKDVVYKTGTRRGTGTGTGRETANYSDTPQAKRTLAGIFMTKGVRAFNPIGDKNKSNYRKALGYKYNDSRCGGAEGVGNYRNGFLKNCPVIALDVERLDGARTDSSKPMHTSPYKSSSGCPALGENENWLMRHLGSQGNSLYIAYTEKDSQSSRFDAHKEVCSKDADLIRDPNDNLLSVFPGLASSGQH